MEITVPEAAERTGLAPETIRRWIRSGKLAARKVGTQHLIDRDRLDAVTGRARSRVAREEAPVYRDPSGSAARRLLDRIVADPAVLAGKPAVRGTRIAVGFVLECLAAGWSAGEIVEQYPGLTEEDVLACLAYAAWREQTETIHRIPSL